MRKLFLILFLFIPFLSFSQDAVLLKHTNYVSFFSTTKYYPLYVEWWLTKEKISCNNPLERKTIFKPDPLLYDQTNLYNDYLRSGYDRGHMCPAADNLCLTQKVLFESNYFSNIAPQTHSLNAGDWNSLEMLSRKLAKELDSIHIWAGNIGEIQKIGKVSVPQYCWKVIHIKKFNTYKAYIFPNSVENKPGIRENEVTVEEIERLTGFKFQ